jgi:glutamate dehydrogenase
MTDLVIQPSPTSPIGGGRGVLGLNIKTDLSISSFPAYVDPFTSSGETMSSSPIAMSATHRLVERVKGDEPGRHPSPQPTHVSYPLMPRANGNGHRVLRSATVGYVAPEFKGKKEQMKQGQHPSGVEAPAMTRAFELTRRQSRHTS